MKPTLETLKAACPDINEQLLDDYLHRLDERYFRIVEKPDMVAHLQALARLSDQHPAEVLLDARRDGTVVCTVLAFDCAHLFAQITGVLAGLGFDIASGDIFTYRRLPEKTDRQHLKKRSLRLSLPPEMTSRRLIIDRFSGRITSLLPFDIWSARLKQEMESVIDLLHQGDEAAVSRAKHRVIEMVVSQLAQQDFQPAAFLAPVDIVVDDHSGPFTRLRITAADSPAFLYALSNALSLQGISIEHVRIRTIGRQVRDDIDLVDAAGEKIEDPETLNRVRLAVLLTKQFTYFLKNAPAPYDALSRFEHLAGEVLRLPEKGRWLDLLSNPHALDELAQVLGASDYLWEDFIRSQYETFLPMLQPVVTGRRFSKPAETLARRLSQELKGAETFDEQRRRLNAFKDREIFLIDLDHILDPKTDFRVLSRRLVRLAEHVVDTAARLAYQDLVRRFGKPSTAAGLEARYAIAGLGKLGGAALGYASDIEILVIYSDNGATDGDASITNAEFFDRLVKGITGLIQAKREGIFHVDLRLRPHGNDGPLACSLESFCRYYGKGGAAHSYERLALVRLRAIGGDPALGDRVERIRDDLVYASKSIDLGELRRLREKQFREKTLSGGLNAKFSPGGMVDLEYAIQILQVIYGKDRPALRTPKTHEALSELSRAGVLTDREAQQLGAAYDFFRRLINAMRMVRGSARDLFLPDEASDEWTHLARRMGYGRGDPLSPSQRLRMDLETHMAAIRVFVDRHFGRESLPGPATGSVADLVLADEPAGPLREAILTRAGFADPARAYVNLGHLAGDGDRRRTFARLALFAFDILKQTPDPDMALNNWERFIRALPSVDTHYNSLLQQPMRLEILLKIFSGSQFLADTMIRHPGFVDWVMIPEHLQRPCTRSSLEQELRMALESCGSARQWRNKIRRFRRREILRIGTRDMCLRVHTRSIMQELSTLAEAMIQVVLDRILAGAAPRHPADQDQDLRNTFCIMALGKLGGEELNYSSDIDLMGLQGLPAGSCGSGGHDSPLQHRCAAVMEALRADLSAHTQEGYAYRVDLRLRPYGTQGCLVPSLGALTRYYHNTASLWEIQAALKMRPVAGNLQVGYAFLDEIRPLLHQARPRQRIVESIETMRRAAIRGSLPDQVRGPNVKAGIGGLRDVEFLVQGLQLIYGPSRPEVFTGNTLAGLERLKEAGILPETATNDLSQDYVFLRRVEHCLQIMEDRQVHALPRGQKALSALAKRVLGPDATAQALTDALTEAFSRIRNAYTTYLLKAG